MFNPNRTHKRILENCNGFSRSTPVLGGLAKKQIKFTKKLEKLNVECIFDLETGFPSFQRRWKISVTRGVVPSTHAHSLRARRDVILHVSALKIDCAHSDDLESNFQF